MKTAFVRTAKIGDFVQGTVAQMLRRGSSGWGVKTHVARVNHRYGPRKELLNVTSLCGRRGRLESGSHYDHDFCKRCVKLAARQGIEWR